MKRKIANSILSILIVLIVCLSSISFVACNDRYDSVTRASIKELKDINKIYMMIQGTPLSYKEMKLWYEEDDVVAGVEDSSVYYSTELEYNTDAAFGFDNSIETVTEIAHEMIANVLYKVWVLDTPVMTTKDTENLSVNDVLRGFPTNVYFILSYDSFADEVKIQEYKFEQYDDVELSYYRVLTIVPDEYITLQEYHNEKDTRFSPYVYYEYSVNKYCYVENVIYAQDSQTQTNKLVSIVDIISLDENGPTAFVKLMDNREKGEGISVFTNAPIVEDSNYFIQLEGPSNSEEEFAALEYRACQRIDYQYTFFVDGSTNPITIALDSIEGWDEIVDDNGDISLKCGEKIMPKSGSYDVYAVPAVYPRPSELGSSAYSYGWDIYRDDLSGFYYMNVRCSVNANSAYIYRWMNKLSDLETVFNQYGLKLKNVKSAFTTFYDAPEKQKKNYSSMLKTITGNSFSYQGVLNTLDKVANYKQEFSRVTSQMKEANKYKIDVFNQPQAIMRNFNMTVDVSSISDSEIVIGNGAVGYNKDEYTPMDGVKYTAIIALRIDSDNSSVSEMFVDRWTLPLAALGSTKDFVGSWNNGEICNDLIKDKNIELNNMGELPEGEYSFVTYMAILDRFSLIRISNNSNVIYDTTDNYVVLRENNVGQYKHTYYAQRVDNVGCVVKLSITKIA